MCWGVAEPEPRARLLICISFPHTPSWLARRAEEPAVTQVPAGVPGLHAEAGAQRGQGAGRCRATQDTREVPGSSRAAAAASRR